MTENQNQNPADPAARSDASTQPSPAGQNSTTGPMISSSTAGPMDASGRKKRRVPLIPAVLAGAALFIVGGLAGGAVGASTVLMSNDSGTSQGAGGPGGQPGGGQQGGGQQGGAGPGGGMAPGGQGSTNQNSNNQDSTSQDSTSQGSDGQSSQSSDDQTADDTSAVDESSEENVALTGLSSVSQEAAVLNREP
ncbi:hypothetical protein [Brevibacterium zhoupengii]|uniref:hypothetical protein n=1 Tax=Brevibacterium zhoupengii TaxID=2898795 RepID=UPI001E62C71F|nr:hypothetical protein [Brevibacterium zhoupengii]